MSADGARLLQVLRTRPEFMALLKTYYSQYLTAAGETPLPESVTDQAVLDRIRTDPSFAQSAAKWLLDLTAQASAALQSSAPVEVAETPISNENLKPPPSTDFAQTPVEASAETKVAPSSQSAVVPASAASSSAFIPAGPTTATLPNPTERYAAQTNLTLRNFPKFFAQDQYAFWTLPLHSDVQSLTFWVPAAFGTAALIGSDTAIEAKLPTSPNTIKMAANGSTAGMLALVGAGGGFFLMGEAQHNDHERETGYLVGEAALDAYAASTLLQYTTQRERPFTGNNKGQFFYGGNSFPSNTAAVSWAAASVFAHEYPGTLTKILAYGLAAGVSAGRVIGEKHWASDAFIGSAVGWYMGTQVFRARSQGPEIDAKNWVGVFEKSSEEKQRDPDYMASTYIPLDSWIYPAFDRLSALGYIPSEIIAIRPWARSEGARLVLEAQSQVQEAELQPDAVVEKILSELRNEFAFELQALEGHSNLGAQLESAYFRMTPIAGTPLRDSFDFAQTLYDDYGRPYGQGFNAVAGVSGRAEAGPLAFYVRGEYQYSNGMAPYSPSVSQQIATFNFLPVNAVPTFPQQSQFRTIEAYVALDVHNWQLSFGQQSQFWSPAFGGSLLLSNNAQPMVMLKLSRTVPYELPEPLSWLGKIRNSVFIGALPNYNFVTGPYPSFSPLYGNPYQNINPIPYTWGDKLALKMTENLEVGVGLSVVWGGLGRPATAKTWLHTFSTQGNEQPLDPGKRYTGINVSYRLPKLRDWAVFYVDGMANDEPNPIAYPQDSAFNPGFYFPRLPKLGNLDLRVEGVYTNLIGYPGTAPYYSNVHYLQGYTTYWQLMGDWVGRQGDGWQATSTYWWSATKKLQFGYRRQYVDKVILGGGGLNDFSGTLNWEFHNDLLVAGGVQYERWNFPLLSDKPKTDVSVQMQVTYWPSHSAKRSGPAVP